MRNPILLSLVLTSSFASAKLKPALTPEAAALLAREAVLLLPEDNQVVALTPKAKPAAFLQSAPKRLEVIASPSMGAPALLLAVDDEAWRMTGTELDLVGVKIAAQ